jgi:farnesyl-diphosphate farnesyltransferase
MPGAPDELLTSLLRDVSRSFYLTLRVLPGAIRPQIGLAYLLARATDTIADTLILPVTDRLATLRRVRERILGRNPAPLDLSEFARHQGSPVEWMLLERVEEALGVLETFRPEDQHHVRQALNVITSGQELDLHRFAGASADAIVALDSDEELDDYIYRVAGCVGEFWTRMCRTNLFADLDLDDELLLANGVRFGKGLQLVNILRDLPSDVRQGRCYLPSNRLWAVGMTPSDLLQPTNAPRLQPLYDSYLAQAGEHLAAGWEYTNALPRSQVRVRLACAWPILIGAQTLEKLRGGNMLAPELHIKVRRSEVYSIIARTIFWYPLPRRWQRIFIPPQEAEIES